MAVIDTLNINLQAATAGLQKGLKSAQGMVTSFASSLNGPLGKLAGVFAGAFGANALKNFVADGLNAADTLMDTANALQVNAEALNQLRHAAVISDVSFEQLAGGIEKLNKNLGTSDNGAQEMVQVLNNLGLLNKQWEHLKQLAPDQAFLALAGAISKIEDPYLKAEAAVRLFGKSGQDLIPFLNQGEEGIKKLGAEVAGAFSPENQKKFDEADAAFKSIAEAFLTMKQDVAIALAPTVVMITKEFEKWLKTLTEIVKLLAESGVGSGTGEQGGGREPLGTSELLALETKYKWLERQAALSSLAAGLGGDWEGAMELDRQRGAYGRMAQLAQDNLYGRRGDDPQTFDKLIKAMELQAKGLENLTAVQRQQLELLREQTKASGVEL